MYFFEKEKEYVKKNITKEWLKQNGFRYNRNYSDPEAEIYTLRFPLHKYKKITTLEGEILIDLSNGNVTVNAYMPDTNDLYPSFYYVPCGNYVPLMKEIDNRINSEFKKLGITKKERGN